MNTLGRPSALKDKISALMADGRERTTLDICLRLQRMTESLRTSTGAALKEMHEMGLIERHTVKGLHTWKKPQDKKYAFHNRLPSSLPFSAADIKRRQEIQQKVH